MVPSYFDLVEPPFPTYYSVLTEVLTMRNSETQQQQQQKTVAKLT